jgi:hypothetical protein
MHAILSGASRTAESEELPLNKNILFEARIPTTWGNGKMNSK